MLKVSVIVPVYNVERYLKKCLDSILTQTLDDIEIICVDDGSTDSSGVILDEYAAAHDKVEVIHQPNRGYGAAINAGFDYAAGEYIGIVESDDYILPNMFEELYRNANQYDLDLVKSECVKFWGELDISKREHVGYLEDYFNRVLESRDRVIFFQFFMNTWTGIYKRRFLLENGIRHNETPGASYQDNGFWIQTMSMCNRCMWLNEAFYMYRMDNPGASIKSRSKVMCMHDEYDYVQKILENQNLLEEVRICKYYRVMRNQGTFIRVSDEYKAEYGRLMIQEFAECYEDVKDLEIRTKDGLFAWYRAFAEDTDSQIAEFIKQKNEVMRRLEKTSRLVLYGAGRVARTTCTRLHSVGVVHKVDTICVSENPQGELMGHKVIALDEVQNLKDALVLIAVVENTNAYLAMEKRLRDKGVTNYMAVTGLFRYFYSL